MTKNFKFTIVIDTDMDEYEAWDKLKEMLESTINDNDLNQLFDVERIEDD